MKLTGCRDQKSKSLDEFYNELSHSDEPVTHEAGRAMCALIERLRALPGQQSVYGLTSHHRLCLLAKDSSETPWFIIIATLDTRNYFIEYLMPKRIAPWPGAYVRGEARSEDDAVQMIWTGMRNSEGWPDVQA
jgi:hypothetical protein